MQPMRLSPKNVAAGALAFVLWLTTIAAGMFEIYLLRQLYVRVTLRSGAEVAQELFGADVLVLALALVWIVFTLGTGEYHRKYVGQARSWRLLAWTAVVEAGLLLLYFIV